MLKVKAAVANLRRDPSHASELVSQLVLGEEASVLEARGEWLRITGRDGYAGWADARSLAACGPWEQSATLVWTRRDGVLREGPEPGSAPVCDLVMGSRVRTAGPDGPGSGTSGAIVLPDGTPAWADPTGWVAEVALETRFPAAPRAIVETALSLAGVPYLWGGTSSKAFDCSGFVQRIFRLHGVALPRDAYQQAEAGADVEPGPGGAGLRPGDLIFFAERGARVTHVAIATGERGRLVHASTLRAGVGTDSLDPSDALYAPALAATLSWAKRLL